MLRRWHGCDRAHGRHRCSPGGLDPVRRGVVPRARRRARRLDRCERDRQDDVAPVDGGRGWSGGRGRSCRGRVGLMQQFIGSSERPISVRDFLLAYSEPAVRATAARVRAAEERLAVDPDEKAQLAYASALAAWEQAGGYHAEVLWDRCAQAAFGGGYPQSAERMVDTLSGGERKRLALENVFA